MIGKTKEQLERIKDKANSSAEESDEIEGISLQEDNLQLLGEETEKKPMTREELLKHKEERKGKFLGDLLQNLNSSLQQLDGVYGGDKIERLNKATSRKREIAE